MGLVDDVLSGAANGAIGSVIPTTGSGSKLSLQSSSQQNQSLNFNPVISVGGGTTTGATSPFNSTPSFSSPLSATQEDRSGVIPSYGLSSGSGETIPQATNASATATGNYGMYILLAALGVGAYMLLGK